MKYAHIILLLVMLILLIKLYNSIKKTTTRKTNDSVTEVITDESKDDTRKIVLYFASWCGHCSNFKPTWNEFKNVAKEKFPNLIVEDIQCDSKTEDNKEKCKNIEGYPTVLLDDTLEYTGDRTIDSLISFVMKN